MRLAPVLDEPTNLPTTPPTSQTSITCRLNRFIVSYAVFAIGSQKLLFPVSISNLRFQRKARTPYTTSNALGSHSVDMANGGASNIVSFVFDFLKLYPFAFLFYLASYF
ncbi:hypothetical protein TWF751_009010 [Orbilia oligospora]|nr:hypothetical protein TWF751_009010 [Orbilia oligospora]